MSNNSGARRKRIRRNEHFISAPNSQGIEAQLERRRAGIHCHSVTTSDVSCEFTLELLCQWSCCEPSGIKHPGDCIQFFRPEARSMKGDESVRHEFDLDCS